MIERCSVIYLKSWSRVSEMMLVVCCLCRGDGDQPREGHAHKKNTPRGVMYVDIHDYPAMPCVPFSRVLRVFRRSSLYSVVSEQSPLRTYRFFLYTLTIQ